MPAPRLRITSLAALCALAIGVGGCGDTLQDHPIPHNTLESLIVNPFPVYWLGGRFHGLAITEASHDPGGSFSVQYGDCLEGGQGTCVSPLRIITSPDDSFLPGESAGAGTVTIRGVQAVVSRAGRTIAIPTGPVVIDIFARDRSLARAAAREMVPINEPGAPQAPLPPRGPATGYAERALPSQEPPPLRPVR